MGEIYFPKARRFMTQLRKLQDETRIDYSQDGYIRLTFQHLCALRFSRRTLMDDGDLCEELLEQDIPAFSAGYCDWLDVSTPARISVGWAWFVTTSGATRLLAPGGISSNVMITSADGRDLGAAMTGKLLHAWLSGQSWQHDSLPAGPGCWAGVSPAH